MWWTFWISGSGLSLILLTARSPSALSLSRSNVSSYLPNRPVNDLFVRGDARPGDYSLRFFIVQGDQRDRDHHGCPFRPDLLGCALRDPGRAHFLRVFEFNLFYSTARGDAHDP